MQQNSTDFIAKTAFDTTKERWKEFIGLPFLVFLITDAFIYFFVMRMRGGALQVILLLLLAIFVVVFSLSFYTALLKWCADLKSGKKEIDVAAGLKYGLSRFWAVVWTGIVLTVKVFLWTLLLVIPGFYKAIQYSQSIHVAMMGDFSGNKATKMSTNMVMGAGFLRTLGNYMSIQVAATLVMYVALAIVGLVGALFLSISYAVAWVSLVSLVFGGIMLAIALFASTFMVIFTNFQYLIYREEQKAIVDKTTKALKALA